MSLLSLETVQNKQALQKSAGLALKLGFLVADHVEPRLEARRCRVQARAAKEAAAILASGVIKQLNRGSEVATVHLQRQSHHGFPGTFLKLAGAEADFILLSKGVDIIGFDLPTSRQVSQVEITRGFSNAPVRDWRPDRISFVFSPDYGIEAQRLGEIALVQPAAVDLGNYYEAA